MLPEVINVTMGQLPPELESRLRRAGIDAVQAIGDLHLLSRPALAVICSVQCAGSVVMKTFDAIRELRDAGVIVAGGFHSPMERECLDFLLRGDQPVIVCPARGLSRLRLPASWTKAVRAGRMLLASPFGHRVRRTTKAQAESRNGFVATIAAAVLIPHASPGGKVESEAHRIVQRGQPLFTIDDPENGTLVTLGAHPFFIAEIQRVLASPMPLVQTHEG